MSLKVLDGGFKDRCFVRIMLLPRNFGRGMIDFEFVLFNWVQKKNTNFSRVFLDWEFLQDDLNHHHHH